MEDLEYLNSIEDRINTNFSKIRKLNKSNTRKNTQGRNHARMILMVRFSRDIVILSMQYAMTRANIMAKMATPAPKKLPIVTANQ